jgi:crotonobetainyl-CoA:carnitine CoA-transferase CaiB-like acyl-CoA transferase
MCEAMGHSDWSKDARFSTAAARHEHHDALDELITSWTSQRSPYDAMHALQKAGVKAAAVLDGRDALLDPHYKARKQYDVVEQPLLGKRPFGKHTAARFTRFDTSPHRRSPLVGEHNEEVLKELGYSDAEIAKLTEDKVIASGPSTTIPPALLSMALKLPYEMYIPAGILQRIDDDYRDQLGIAD